MARAVQVGHFQKATRAGNLITSWRRTLPLPAWKVVLWGNGAERSQLTILPPFDFEHLLNDSYKRNI